MFYTLVLDEHTGSIRACACSTIPTNQNLYFMQVKKVLQEDKQKYRGILFRRKEHNVSTITESVKDTEVQVVEELTMHFATELLKLPSPQITVEPLAMMGTMIHKP